MWIRVAEKEYVNLDTGCRVKQKSKKSVEILWPASNKAVKIPDEGKLIDWLSNNHALSFVTPDLPMTRSEETMG